MPASGPDDRRMRWRATAAARALRWREFDDGTVVYRPDTGETLLLSPLASFLLEGWRASPEAARSLDDLIQAVEAVDDSAMDADVGSQLVTEALAQLAQAGLVAPHA